MRASWVLLIGLLGACSASNGLTVQLASNMAPGTEIDEAHVVIARDGATVYDTTVPLTSSASLGRPMRLASVSPLPAGRHEITVTLSLRGALVQHRRVVSDVEAATYVTVLMTRDCNGVSCPGSGDPSAEECLGGRCVQPECDEEHPELCPHPECHLASDCAITSVACAPPTCSASGTCFARPDDTLCAPGQLCDESRGCIATGTDGGIAQLDASIDAGVNDAGPCTAWTNRQLLAPLNSTQNDWGAEISTDGLRLYYSSDRGTSDDLYYAERATRTSPFTAPVPIAELNSAVAESDPTLTGDELEIFFDSARTGGHTCVWTSTRPSTSMPWAAPTELSQLCTSFQAGGPYVSRDGLRLYYSSQLDAYSEGQIYVSTRTSRSMAFAAGTPLAGLPAAQVGFAAFSADELTIYFESSASGHIQPWTASRASPSAPFTSLHPIAEASATDDGDVSVTADGTQLLWSTFGSGRADLAQVDRTCP